MMARASTGAPGVIAVALALSWAWCCGGAQAGDREDVAKLTQLSHAWDQAIVAKKEAAVAGNMAEDFRIIDGQAGIGDKKQFLADILDARLTIDPYTVEDFEVRLYGDVALLSGRTHMTGKFDGKPFESNYRYIDIYARRGGEWRIVSVQITRIPPASAEGK
jgi:ketosteroid isomerase-like protein